MIEKRKVILSSFFILKIRKLKGLKKIFIGGIIKSISTHKYTSKTGGAISIL